MVVVELLAALQDLTLSQRNVDCGLLHGDCRLHIVTGMQSPTLTWHASPDGAVYTTPRKYAIERLANGKYRVFHYGPNLSALYDTLIEAYRACGYRFGWTEVIA